MFIRFFRQNWFLCAIIDQKKVQITLLIIWIEWLFFSTIAIYLKASIGILLSSLCKHNISLYLACR